MCAIFFKFLYHADAHILVFQGAFFYFAFFVRTNLAITVSDIKFSSTFNHYEDHRDKKYHHRQVIEEISGEVGSQTTVTVIQ